MSTTTAAHPANLVSSVLPSRFLRIPNEVIERILHKLPIDSLICAIRTCHKFSDTAAGSRELLIWHLTYLPGTKQFIFKFSTQELFRMFYHRATQHLYGMQFAADCAEYVVESGKIDTNLSILVERDASVDNLTAYLVLAESAEVHAIGVDGAQKLTPKHKFSSPNKSKHARILAVSHGKGVAAVLYQENGDQSAGNMGSPSFFLAQFASETGSMLSELPIRKDENRHGDLCPVNMAIYCQDHIAVQWQRMLDRQRILDQKPALAIGEVTIHQRDEATNGKMISKVIEEKMGPYLQNPYVAKNLFEVRFADKGNLLKLYLQQSVVPVGALNVSQGGYYCRNNLIVPDMGPSYCETPFYQKCEAYKTHPVKNNKDLSVLPNDGLKYRVFHLLLAQPALPHNTPLEDHSLLFVVKHSLHLDSHRYEHQLYSKDFPSVDGGDCQIIATLDSWGTVEPAKMRADAIAVNSTGSKIACIRSSRDIVVWGFDPAELCRVEKYPVVDQIDNDFDTRLRHTRLYRNAPNLRPIILDCNGAEPMKLKWSTGPSDELVVLTNRGIQVWNVGLRASGKRTVEKLTSR